MWKRPQSYFPSLPTGMDRILKEHFARFIGQEILPPEIALDPDTEGLHLFSDKEQLKIWQDNFKGLSYKDDQGNVLQGAIDNILVSKENKLIVLDYKTRGHDINPKTPYAYKKQLELYNLLLRKIGYLTEEYSFLLFYIPKEVAKTGEVIFDTKLVKIKTEVFKAEKLLNKALDLLNNECPIESCEWCVGR